MNKYEITYLDENNKKIQRYYVSAFNENAALLKLEVLVKTKLKDIIILSCEVYE